MALPGSLGFVPPYVLSLKKKKKIKIKCTYTCKYIKLYCYLKYIFVYICVDRLVSVLYKCLIDLYILQITVYVIRFQWDLILWLVVILAILKFWFICIYDVISEYLSCLIFFLLYCRRQEVNGAGLGALLPCLPCDDVDLVFVEFTQTSYWDLQWLSQYNCGLCVYVGY